MPHSTTKKHRPKRPDHRPNYKDRKKALAKKIQTTDKRELMPNTTIPSSLRKERIPTGVLKPMVLSGKEESGLSSEEARIRSLQKVMRQIQVLQQRQEAGERLNDAQVEKINRLDSVIDELEELLDIKEGNESDEEEEQEEEVLLSKKRKSVMDGKSNKSQKRK